MALIKTKDQDYLRQHFAKALDGEVRLVYFTQGESPLEAPAADCQFCKETRDILEEVAALSDKITLEVHDFAAEQDLAKELGVDKIPATIITGKANGSVRYFGVPGGYEFSSLIEDIVDVSKGTTDLSDATRKALAGLIRPVNIQVFVTPT